MTDANTRLKTFAIVADSFLDEAESADETDNLCDLMLGLAARVSVRAAHEDGAAMKEARDEWLEMCAMAWREAVVEAAEMDAAERVSAGGGVN